MAHSMNYKLKNGEEYRIRMAKIDDAAALVNIYAPYVIGTAITFEYDIPSVEEFKDRITQHLERYPYLVAETDKEILGYAYTGVFKDRAAYDWAVENSVYLCDRAKGQGIGKNLYKKLEEISKAQNIQNLYSCITVPVNELDDEYVTMASVHFHEHMGYRMVGKFLKCGYKFGRWYDMVWMEKFIGNHTFPAENFIPLPELTIDI